MHVRLEIELSFTLPKMDRRLGENLHYGVPASIPPDPKFHGDKMEAARPLGDAERIASTPVSKVIIVGSELAVPSVATIITVSPLWRSARFTAGIRLSIC